MAHSSANPYATIPPIGRLLDLFCARLSVGGCFKPGNRNLADWLGYASASQIPYMLSQLACEDWIAYDPQSGVITLLRDYRSGELIDQSDRSISSPDRSDNLIDQTNRSIGQTDRDIPQQDAENESDQVNRSIPQCMEDSCSVVIDSDSTTTELKIPCGEKPISAIDQRAADLVMAEYGVFVTLRKQALAARPDLTPQQVRDTYAHFKPDIDAGRCTDRAFFKAIALGEIYPAPAELDRPLNPANYATDPAFVLGGTAPPGDTEPESIRDHAARLLPAPTAATIREYTRDWLFLQGRLAADDSDAQALAALDAYRKAVRR